MADGLIAHLTELDKSITEEDVRVRTKSAMAHAAMKLAQETGVSFRTQLLVTLGGIARDGEQLLEAAKREDNGFGENDDHDIIASRLLRANEDILIHFQLFTGDELRDRQAKKHSEPGTVLSRGNQGNDASDAQWKPAVSDSNSWVTESSGNDNNGSLSQQGSSYQISPEPSVPVVPKNSISSSYRGPRQQESSKPESFVWLTEVEEALKHMQRACQALGTTDTEQPDWNVRTSSRSQPDVAKGTGRPLNPYSAQRQPTPSAPRSQSPASSKSLGGPAGPNQTSINHNEFLDLGGGSESEKDTSPNRQRHFSRLGLEPQVVSNNEATETNSNPENSPVRPASASQPAGTSGVPADLGKGYGLDQSPTSNSPCPVTDLGAIGYVCFDDMLGQRMENESQDLSPSAPRAPAHSASQSPVRSMGSCSRPPSAPRSVPGSISTGLLYIRIRSFPLRLRPRVFLTSSSRRRRGAVRVRGRQR